MSPADPSPKPSSADDITAVIVSWNPNRDRFTGLLHRLETQVGLTIIVDNGSAPDCIAWLRGQVAESVDQRLLIELDRNLGVAAAQNRGIDAAIARGSLRVLLLDHDSLPARDMVERLAETLDKLEQAGHKVGAVGPCYLDQRQQNPPPFVRVSGGRLHRLPCPSPDTLNQVDYLIASGSLLPVEALRGVGTMDERLFIDYVDIEWGLRAGVHGWLSYGVCSASMEHDLGEEPIVAFGRALPSHSPIRHYYHFRNAVWLYLRARVPLQWKFVDGYRLLLRFAFYSLFARPRSAHISAMLRGVAHGLIGRLGPAPATR